MTRDLYIHDNMQVLRGLDSESVDLIATDPPFNSKRIFSAHQDSSVPHQRFDDRWRWTDMGPEWSDATAQDCPAGVREVIETAAIIEGGTVDRAENALDTGRVKNSMAAYLCWLAPRLIEMKRVLRKTGSIYIHCDDAADSYIRLLLDAVFGRKQFRNAITWRRHSGNNSTGKRCGRNADTILFYAASADNVWNGGCHRLSRTQLARYKPDENGRLYRLENLSAPRPSGNDDLTWRGTYSKNGWRHSLNQREQLWAAGMIAAKADGSPRLDGHIKYLDESGDGQPLQSIWTDIDRVANNALDRTGWRTQKPVALYERIVRASSNPGDLVLDPFCGCCTTLIAAERLGRSWIGCDIDPACEDRLNEQMTRLVPKRGIQPALEIASSHRVRKTPPRRTDTDHDPKHPGSTSRV